MAYDESLANRIRQLFINRNIDNTEKKMMGGLTFMVDDKMCVGVHEKKLMARIDPFDYEKALELEGCIKMDFTGREMKGFIFVLPEGTNNDTQLNYWIELALKYNPKAKSSRKRKKK